MATVAESDGHLTASADLPTPGVYRIEVKGGGASAVTEQVMAVAREDYSLKAADE